MFEGTAIISILEGHNHLAVRYRYGEQHFHINLPYDAAHDLAHALEDAVRSHRGTVHDQVGRPVHEEESRSDE